VRQRTLESEILLAIKASERRASLLDSISRYRLNTEHEAVSTDYPVSWTGYQKIFYWMDGVGPRTLFFYGHPGAGKTTMTYQVFDKLQRGHGADPTTGLAFVPIQRAEAEPALRSERDILFAILRQPVERRPALMQKIQQPGASSITTNLDLVRDITICIGTMSRVFVFVDALDEFSGNTSSLITVLLALVSNPTVFLLLTSATTYARIESVMDPSIAISRFRSEDASIEKFTQNEPRYLCSSMLQDDTHLLDDITRQITRMSDGV